MKIPVAVTRYETPPEDHESHSEALRIALRIAGFSSLIGACVCFWGGLIASPWLGIGTAVEGFVLFVALFVLGWLCFSDPFSDR